MPNDVRSYVFEVEMLHTGQRRKYGPSEQEYILRDKSDYPSEFAAKQFALAVVYQPVRFPDHPNSPFDSTEEFEKIGENKYRYSVHIPSTH